MLLEDTKSICCDADVVLHLYSAQCQKCGEPVRKIKVKVDVKSWSKAVGSIGTN